MSILLEIPSLYYVILFAVYPLSYPKPAIGFAAVINAVQEEGN